MPQVSLKMLVIGCACAIAVGVLALHGEQAAAQSQPLAVVAVDIVPGQIDNYLSAIKENGAAAVKEPGCREFNISISEKDPNHVLLFEVYEDAAALEAHRATDHFKKYAATTKDMVAKRDLRMFSSVAINMKGK
jgi:quinol monooxygenase YgiN